jgi:hypothetical protein
MGQILHGSATTTGVVRLAIQRSSDSLRTLSKRYGINPKTAPKWKKRTSVVDLPTGPRSTVLSVEDEAVIVAFRRHTLLPLDDCLYALQPTIPHLSRSALHRCLQRRRISRLPEVGGDKPAKKCFKRDLPPWRPSFITRVCWFDIRRFRVAQARRVRRSQIAQVPGALARVSGCQEMNVA